MAHSFPSTGAIERAGRGAARAALPLRDTAAGAAGTAFGTRLGHGTADPHVALSGPPPPRTRVARHLAAAGTVFF